MLRWDTLLNHYSGKVTSAVGVFIDVSSLPEDQTSEVAKVSFARVLVDMDINSPVASSFLVRLPRQEPFKVYVRYPKLPKICFKCDMLIHDTSACLRSSPARDDEGLLKFGLWLKDTGLIQMPLPVHAPMPIAAPLSDPLDGICWGILFHVSLANILPIKVVDPV